MRVLLIALLAAISYAQTVSTTASGATCKFDNGQTVENGWSGRGFANEHCNTCMCRDGLLMCTLMLCETTTTAAPTLADCTLTGGETVAHAWSGKDTGSNSCNQCICSNGKLMCTRMGCAAAIADTSAISVIPIVQPGPVVFGKSSTPSTPETQGQVIVVPVPGTAATQSQVVVVPSAPAATATQAVPSAVHPGIGVLPADKAACGGKTQNKCHTLMGDMCASEPCCRLVGSPQFGTKCMSITKILHPTGGLECGDFGFDQCQKDPACLWNTIELECDELKEMDCQDLTEEHCHNAQMCSWIFDEVRYACRETKEVEGIARASIISGTQGLNAATPGTIHRQAAAAKKLQSLHQSKTETSNEAGERRVLISAMAFVGIILGCALGSLIPTLFSKKTKVNLLKENLTLGMIHRQV